MKENNENVLQEEQNQQKTETAPEALVDEQMEQVAGGKLPPWKPTSIPLV